MLYFPYKMRCRQGKSKLCEWTGSVSKFMVGRMLESSSIVNDPSYDLCHTSYCDFSGQAKYLEMWEYHFPWRAQPLVMLERHF